MYFCIAAITGITNFTLQVMHQQYRLQRQTVTLQQFNIVTERFALWSLVLELSVSAVIWVWVRWTIRDFVWNGLKTGKTFHFLLNAGDSAIGAVKATLAAFALPVAVWVITVFVLPFPQNLLSLLNQR